MLLRDVMTRNVEDISSEMKLTEAAQKMRALDVGALPVCENGRMVGMLTDRDIALRAVAEGRDPMRTSAKEAMTPSIIYCFDDQDVREAVSIMEDRQIRRLLVFNRQNEPCGIVSLGDIATRLHDEHLSSEVLERVSEPCQPMPS
ncbi:MAG TPA: CBS domain-containing protein [Tepidisphaeraceae bacterium]|jgi:CBS domain-containing protein|nr:CBS domain-containing protein [Tepidisphaeraceae bacterium]